MGYIVTILAVLLASQIASRGQGTNLLANPSFEEPAAGYAADTRYPAHWSVTGTANRCTWRDHGEGQWCVGICGEWANMGRSGEVTQEGIPVEAGAEYVLIPWLYADHDWAPIKQYLRVEFYSSDNEEALARNEVLFHDVFQAFRNHHGVHAEAPQGSTHARVVIGVDGVSKRGGLTVDDVFFGKYHEGLRPAPGAAVGDAQRLEQQELNPP